MRILIIGASGFIGTHLAQFAEKDGHEVIALCRSGRVDGIKGNIFKWALGEPLPKESLENIHCAIHLAHDFNGKTGADLTFSSTLDAIQQIRAAAVPRQIYYSSYSAGKHAVSLYGQTKFAIEQKIADAEDTIIIRPGLVIGDGGIYGRIKKCAETFPAIPLPDGGKKSVPIIEIDKLCQETLLYASGLKQLK